jgi:hypothetical protein
MILFCDMLYVLQCTAFYLYLLIVVIVVHHPCIIKHVRLSREPKSMAEDLGRTCLTFVVVSL